VFNRVKSFSITNSAAAQRSVFKEIVGLMSNLMPDLPLPFLGAILAQTCLSTGTPFLGHVGVSPFWVLAQFFTRGSTRISPLNQKVNCLIKSNYI